MIRRARQYVYELLHTPEIETSLERYVRATLTILIVLNILAVIFETVQSIEAAVGPELHAFELFTVIVFTIEYALRMWSIVEDPDYSHPITGRLRYAAKFMSIVDLVAILPFYVPHLIKADLRFVRSLRLVRLLRVLKLGHYSTSLTMLTRVFQKKKYDIGITVFLLLLILIFSSSLMYFLEHDAQPNQFSSIPASLWWGVATISTVGYGDVVPVTLPGRICSAFITLIGVGVFALPSGILAAGFIEESTKKVVLCSKCSEPVSS